MFKYVWIIMLAIIVLIFLIYVIAVIIESLNYADPIGYLFTQHDCLMIMSISIGISIGISILVVVFICSLIAWGV